MNRSIIRAAVILLTVFGAAPASFGQVYSVQTYAVGRMPQGVAAYSSGTSTTAILAVANTGDNTVTILQATSSGVVPVKTVQITSPFDVASCPDGTFLVTSSGSTVTHIQNDGTILNAFNVGSGAYAAYCFSYESSGSTTITNQAIVSSSGDSSLSLIDLASGTVKQKITGIPAAAYAGDTLVSGNFGNSPFLGYVASTSMNRVTIVDLVQGSVAATLFVPQPIAMTGIAAFPAVIPASGALDFIQTTTLTLEPLGTATLANPASAFAYGNTPCDTFAISNGAVIDTVSIGNGQAVSVPGISGAAEIVSFSLGGKCAGMVVTIPNTNSIAVITPVIGPAIAAVTNAASFDAWSPAGTHPFQTGAVGGALASAFTPVQSSSPTLSATTLPLPTTLGGATVNVGGTAVYTNSGWSYSSVGAQAAPLIYVSPTQINFQMPPGIQGAFVPIQIVYANGATVLSSVGTGSVDPGIFTLNSLPDGQGAVLNQNNSLNGPTSPAARGSTIQIFATGAGPTTPALPAGQAAPANGSPLILTQAHPTVLIGGLSASVSFSGLAPGFVGLWQINATVPTFITPGSSVSLQIGVGNQYSNLVTIAVQ